MTQTVAEPARPLVDLAGLRTLPMFEAQAEAVLPADAFAAGRFRIPSPG